MSKEKARDLKRAELLDTLAAFILREGLGAASLRPLAAAAGTSDRMLLYYFANKEDLLACVLGHVADQLRGMLEASLPKPMPYRPLLRELLRLVRRPAFRPYLQVWLELTARAGRGEEPFHRIAAAIADGFLEWTSSRLQVRGEAARARQSALLFSLVEAAVLFDAVGKGRIADQAAELLLS